MDKASDFGSEDCRFKSCHGRARILFVPGRELAFAFYPLLSSRCCDEFRIQAPAKKSGP